MMQEAPIPRDPTSAALILQNAWRSQFRFYTTAKVVKRFLATNLSTEYMKSIT